jgi:hypothetical protein
MFGLSIIMTTRNNAKVSSSESPGQSLEFAQVAYRDDKQSKIRIQSSLESSFEFHFMRALAIFLVLILWSLYKNLRLLL